jgi:hypothetical protein
MSDGQMKGRRVLRSEVFCEPPHANGDFFQLLIRSSNAYKMPAIPASSGQSPHGLSQ